MGIPTNNEIRFEPINTCNYNCQMCNVHKQTRGRGVMTRAMFNKYMERILSETDQYDTIAWAGIGEPLLNGEIVAMTRDAVAMGMKTLLVTNGAMLTKNTFLALQDAGLHSVRVSFHGATPRGYAAMHGRGEAMFLKTYRNVIDASEAREDTRLLVTWAQAAGINDDGIDEWKRMFEGRVDLMEIWRAHNWAGELNFREEQECKLPSCGRVKRGPLQVQWDGKIVPCCFDWNGRMEFGDLNTQSLSDIFSSRGFRFLEIAHSEGRYPVDIPCRHCDQRNADKSDVLIYTSQGIDHEDRVKRTSTDYSKTME